MQGLSFAHVHEPNHKFVCFWTVKKSLHKLCIPHSFRIYLPESCFKTLISIFFSFSLIGCGLIQAHYSLKNVSPRSREATLVFIKMGSSASDIIIFLFLGISLVKQNNGSYWHTGFVSSKILHLDANHS